tara:strand:+ start:22 stop:174 length:153 start_codon:yes stop_codon:yes gene_type:complete
MVATFPTSQVDRSPLKAPAFANTAQHKQENKSKDKTGWKKGGKKRRKYNQ